MCVRMCVYVCVEVGGSDLRQPNISRRLQTHTHTRTPARIDSLGFSVQASSSFCSCPYIGPMYVCGVGALLRVCFHAYLVRLCACVRLRARLPLRLRARLRGCACVFVVRLDRANPFWGACVYTCGGWMDFPASLAAPYLHALTSHALTL